MAAREVVATTPASLVSSPTGSVLYFQITVTNAAAVTVSSLLPGAALPSIPVANINGPAGQKYRFTTFDIMAETDPGAVAVRYTDDSQAVPAANLGFIIPSGLSGGWLRIPTSPDNVKVISTGANVTCQVRLIITAVSV